MKKEAEMVVKISCRNGSSIEASDHEVIISKRRISKKDWAANAIVPYLVLNLFKTLKERMRDFEQSTTPYDRIASLNIYEGGLLSSPYIQIIRFGDNTAKNAAEIDAISYGLRIDKSDVPTLRELANFIEIRLRSPPVLVQPPTTQHIGVADEIRKLIDLRDAGIISEQDFEAQKNKLLRGNI